MADALPDHVIESNRVWAEGAASRIGWQNPTAQHPPHTVAAQNAKDQLAAAIKRNGG